MTDITAHRQRRLSQAGGWALALVGALAVVGALALGVSSAQTARPDANVRAGALALPDRSFLNNRASSCDFYVDPGGSDSNPGTQAEPWRTLRKAAATLTAGKVGCLNSGTYEETGASAANSGTQTAPIVLQRTPGSPTRPVIRLVQTSAVLRIDRGYWVVDGLEFDLNRKVTTGLIFGPSGHHIAMRNSYVHDDARGAAVYVAADDVTVEDSEIANNFHADPARDSHGIAIFGHAARVLVRGNRIHDNGGDGVQCADEIDEGPTTDPVVPVDLTIEDNRFWTSPENLGRTEQGVDIKSCRQVSIRGTVRPDVNDPNAANQKFYGFKNSSSGAGGGGAVVIHLRARNVLVENNRIWDSCHGVGIGRHDTTFGVPENVVVRRNVMFDLKAIGGACTGYGIGIQRVTSADVYHNTLDRLAGSGFRFKHGTGTAGRSPNVDFFNNIVRNARYFLEVATGEIDGFASDHNLFWSSDGNQSRFAIGAPQSLSSWQAKQNGTSVLLADRNSRVADPLFVPGAGTTDDYYTQPASPARDRAVDNTGAARFGAGPDLGFRETYDAPNPEARCHTATAGAAWPGEAFSPQSSKFTATLDAIPLDAPIAAGVGLSQGTAQQWTGMAAIVLFDDVSGNIKARDGGAYTAVTPIPYQANVKYRVRFVVDVAAHRYSAYVTPPGGGEITIGTNLAFRTEQQAVTSLDTRTVAAGIGSLQACDLQISGASAPSPSTTTVFALGDGADGSSSSRELAAYIQAQNPERFFYLGDVYATGTADEFARNYDQAYGALAHKTDPVIGNHEYPNRSSGYYPYWQQKRGWTSEQSKQRSYVTPEGWQVIAYSSEHDPAAEARWVANEVAKHAGTCRIVMAHKGRHVVTDSEHGDNPGQEPIWSLIANKTAINLVGHNHIYGRLAPIDGVNVIVSGAGKAGLRPLGSQHHTVVASQNRVPTATKLVLRPGAADFQQVDKNGTVYDSGRITCVTATPWATWSFGELVATGVASAQAAHPQTITDAAGLSRLRAARTGSHRWLADTLKKTLDRYKDSQPSAAGVGGYAIAAQIFNDSSVPDASRYIAAAKRGLLAMGGGDRGNDLAQAAYLRNAALAYDLLYPALSDGERSTVRARLADSAANLSQAAANGIWWTRDYTNNHNWVNFSALGLAGYALRGEDLRADGWVRQALDNAARLQPVFDAVKDGSWHEGRGYLEFGLFSQVPFWISAQRQGVTVGDSALVRQLGRYVLATQAPGHERLPVVTNGDANWSRPGLPLLLHYTAARFRDPYAQEAARRWEADTNPVTARSGASESIYFPAMQYVVYDPTVPAVDTARVPLDFYADDQQTAVMRTGWGPDATVLAFKNGVFGGRGNFERVKAGRPPGTYINFGHDHVDDLGLSLYGKGGWYLTETHAYNCCGNPGGDYGYSTRYHSSLLIDGVGQLGDDRGTRHGSSQHAWFFSREASMPLHVSTQHYAFARGDGTRLYPSSLGAESLLRTTVLSRDGYAVLHDQARFGSARRVEQLFHFQLSASAGGGWVKGTNENDHVLGIRTLAPAAVSTAIGTLNSNECYSLCPGTADTGFFSHARVGPRTAATDTTFLELLWPTTESGWASRPDAQPLDVANPERGFTIPLPGGPERWVYATGTTTLAGEHRLDGGQIGVARSSQSGLLQRVALLGQGSLFDKGGSRLLLATPGDGVAEVAFTGTRADVSGTVTAGIRFYGPDVTEVRIDGTPVPWSRQDGGIVSVGASGGGPSVRITAPTSGATVMGTIPVSADATSDAGVASVQFLLDDAPLGAPQTTAPYSTTLDTESLSDGRHRLQARVTDNDGQVATSTVTDFTVDNDGASSCQTAAPGQWPSVPFAGAQTGRFTAEADVTPTATPVAGAVALSSGPQSQWQGLAAIVLFNNENGRIEARDGDVYRAATAVSYELNKTYHVRMVVDVATHTYAAYVTPPGGAEVALGTALAFRTEQRSVASLDSWTVAAGLGSLRACGFTLTPEPPGSCQTAAPGQWPSVPFAGAQTGRFTAEADVTPTATPVAGAVALSSGPQSQWQGLAAIVLFNNENGRIEARDGDVYRAATAVSYELNKTYHVRMVVDVATHTYAAYVTPPGGAEVALGTALAFRTEQRSVASLDSWTVAAGLGSLRACGFTLTPEPPGSSRCDTATAGAAWPGEAFSAQSGRFTATLDATPLAAPIAAGVGLSQGTAQNWTGMAAIVLFDDVTGNIKARDGGAYTAVTPIPYQANATYRVRFVVDVPAHRYSAYVTPPGGGEITIGTNLAFRTEQQAVTSLDTRTLAAGIGSLRACNLQISGAPDPSPSTTTVFALGDGADGSTASRELANYVRAQNPDRFFYLGDVYATGTADEFAHNYDPAYGALAHKTDPVIGNHEYPNRSSGYYPYWQQKRGWTSEQAKHRSYVTPEGWQVIAYSSEHDPAAEASWVSSQVATHPGTCRIVMAHKGRHVVTDSEHGDNPGQEPIWSLIANKTAINLVGHNHIYGRLAPIDGVTVIVSGAGKAGLRPLGSQHHTVVASQNGVPTATKLVLRRGAADFQQVDKNGTVYDSGTITCSVG
jgi:hypothetical protein